MESLCPQAHGFPGGAGRPPRSSLPADPLLKGTEREKQQDSKTSPKPLKVSSPGAAPSSRDPACVLPVAGSPQALTVSRPREEGMGFLDAGCSDGASAEVLSL